MAGMEVAEGGLGFTTGVAKIINYVENKELFLLTKVLQRL